MDKVKKQIILNDLEKREYFKVIVGASVNNADLIERLAFTYTLAEASAIDISPLASSVEAAKRGIELALSMAPSLGVTTPNRAPAIVTSIGQPNDMHFFKASINEDICKKCGICAKTCPDYSITKELSVTDSLCRGCGWCVDACPSKPKAISLKPTQNDDIPVILERCISAGADFIEIHISGATDEVFDDILTYTKNVVSDDDMLAIVLGSGVMSPVEILERAKRIERFHPQSNTIIQADGAPMSNTDIPALDVANFLLYNDELKGLWVQVSGGVDEFTRMKADFLGLKINGTGLGIASLETVRDQISREDFYSNTDIIMQSVRSAQELVKSCRGQNNNIVYQNYKNGTNNNHRRWGATFSNKNSTSVKLN